MPIWLASTEASERHRRWQAGAGSLSGIAGSLSQPEPLPLRHRRLPSPSPLDLLWVRGFEPGDLSEWGLVQVEAPDRAQIVTSPVAQGTYALRLTTRYGDVDSSSGTATNRAQINGLTIHQEGEEDYTRVSLRVPSGFPVGTASNDFQVPTSGMVPRTPARRRSVST